MHGDQQLRSLPPYRSVYDFHSVSSSESLPAQVQPMYYSSYGPSYDRDYDSLVNTNTSKDVSQSRMFSRIMQQSVHESEEWVESSFCTNSGHH